MAYSLTIGGDKKWAMGEKFRIIDGSLFLRGVQGAGRGDRRDFISNGSRKGWRGSDESQNPESRRDCVRDCDMQESYLKSSGLFVRYTMFTENIRPHFGHLCDVRL